MMTKGRQPFTRWAVEVEGEIHSSWHYDIYKAVADFKAGLDDVLDSVNEGDNA